MRAVPWKSGLRDESGQVLIASALSMTVLLGFVAMAVDVGLLFRAKRNVQTAADAGATAGALDYYETSNDSYAKEAAIAAAKANGFTTQPGGVQVTPISPVTSGAHTGKGTVEVIITQPNPTFFMRVLGPSSMSVGARAVAGMVSTKACVYLMNKGLILQGQSTIQGWDPVTNTNKTGCGIFSNGNVDVGGGSNWVNMAYVATAGTLIGKGGHNTNPAPVVTGAPPEPIPPALKINPPTPTSSTFGGSCGLPPGAASSKWKSITTYTATISAMSPGTCFGIGSLDPAKTNLDLTISSGTNLASGMYGFNLGTATTNKETGGTLTVGDASGSGITLDIYTGNFAVTSTNSAGLSAPTTGIYSGVLLLEPSTNTGTINIQWGSAKGKFDGIIDAPGAGVTLQDNGGNALVTGLVAGSLTMGTGKLNLVSYTDAHPGSSPFRTVALVE